MKKMMFVAMAAMAMMVASCGQKMSPEAEQAWTNFKATAEKISTEEAIDQFESFDEFNAAVMEWNNAAQEMAKYTTEYSKEIADSMNTIAIKVGDNVQKITALKEAAAAQMEEATEATEEAVEEATEEIAD